MDPLSVCVQAGMVKVVAVEPILCVLVPADVGAVKVATVQASARLTQSACKSRNIAPVEGTPIKLVRLAFPLPAPLGPGLSGSFL